MDHRTIAPTYFCTGNRFPIELEAIEDSRASFQNFLRHSENFRFFYTVWNRGDIADELENVAHMEAPTELGGKYVLLAPQIFF